MLTVQGDHQILKIQDHQVLEKMLSSAVKVSPGGSGGCGCNKARAGGASGTKRVTKKKTTTNNKTKKTKK